MAEGAQTVRLPDGELGEDRCFRVSYEWHGDLFIATWQGSVDFEPEVSDGVSRCFNMRHGADATVLASLIGYYRRIGRTEAEVAETFMQAAAEAVADDLGDLRGHNTLNASELVRIARGGDSSWDDIPALGLMALSGNIAARPQGFARSGGTSFHTHANRANPGGDDYLVIAAHLPGSGKGTDESGVALTADFVPTDVPLMARAVCNLSMGEYRRDIQRFMLDVFSEEDPDDY